MPARPLEPWEPTRLPPWQGLLTPVLVHLFAELRVGVALWAVRDQWHPFHEESSVTEFESDQGVMPRRWAYNARCLERAGRTRQIVMGEHAGFHDLFAPVHDAGEPRGILVAGPFATGRPTAPEVRARWHALSGSNGRIADPSFARYLSATLSTLTLDRSQLDVFERLMTCFANVLVARGDATALTAEVEAHRKKLVEARYAERVWGTARMMIEGRTERAWDHNSQGAAVGLSHPPEHVVVGLLLGRPDDADPVDDVIRRNAFQHACVALSRKHGDVVCSPVGDHGVAFLVHTEGSRARARAKLIDVAARAWATARRHGLELRAGISQAAGSGLLRARYDAALWAAEKALSLGQSVVFGEPRPARSVEQLRKLRAELGKSLGDRPDLLAPRFDRYVEAVLRHSGYRLEATRANLESGLERLAEPLLSGGFVDQRTFDELSASMERAADDARTVMELVASYRRLVSDIEAAMQKPTAARQDRGARRAFDFIRDHLGEPLSLAQVARVAGFGPDHFSELFKRDQGVTFAHYLQAMRVERAKQMLAGTKLNVEQVQTLCGFRNRVYFHRIFKTAVGKTPRGYRADSTTNPRLSR